MPPHKFKMRLGSEEHALLYGRQYVRGFLPDTYNCRLSLRCGPLQATGTGDFTTDQLATFTNSLIRIVCGLRGECRLESTTAGSFSIHVFVANTGKIVTEVTVETLTSISADAVGWNAHARFHTPWNEYYNPINVASLNVSTLINRSGFAPTIAGEDTPGR